MRNQRLRRPVAARVVTALAVGALVASACGASESSTGADRDRNVPVGPGALFTKAVDGVARNKISDSHINVPHAVFERAQADGSTLFGLASLVIDGKGSRSELNIARLNPDGTFDPAFGKNGVQTLSLPNSITPSVAFDSNGLVVVPQTETSPAGDLKIVGLSRFDAATGRADATFGTDGNLAITPVFSQGKSLAVADDRGGVLVFGTDSDTQVAWYLSRWTAEGLDTTFGTNGRVDMRLPSPAELEIDATFSCQQPYFSPGPDRSILALYGCVTRRDVLNEDGYNIAYSRRAIVARTITADGSLNGDIVSFLDDADIPNSYFNEPAVLDVDFGSGDDADSTYVTIDANYGSEVLQFKNDFATFVPEKSLNGLIGIPLPTTVAPFGEFGSRNLGFARFVETSAPRFIGVSVDYVRTATTFEVGPLQLAGGSHGYLAPSEDRLAVAGVPMLSHSIDRIDAIGDDIFMNIVTEARAGDGTMPVGVGRVADQSGYMMIGSDGSTREPYGSANGLASSPLNGNSPAYPTWMTQQIFPAFDGSLYSLGFRWETPVNDADPARVVAVVVKYDARGNEIDVSEFELLGFSPFFFQSPLNDFDGVDNFYISGMGHGSLGVAKLSLSKNGLDTSYGTDGMALFSSANDIDLNGPWFAAKVQANPDGTVDAFNVSWLWTPDEFGRYPLELKSMRFSADGQVDASSPTVKVQMPELARCECPNDSLSLAVANAAVVDASGRLLVVLPDLFFTDESGGEVPMRPTAFHGGATFESARMACGALRACPGGRLGGGVRAGGQIRRYTRDGSLDTTFGSAGTSNVSLYELGAEIPLGIPALAVNSQNQIFMTVIGLELGFPADATSEFDLTVDGEFSYSIMLSANGMPVGFTPREPDPATNYLTDLINESRSELGSGGGSVGNPLTGGNGASSAPIATPPGVSADSVMDPDSVLVGAGDRPVIIITGTPADRAIDVRWSVPESLAQRKATYTVTASPGGQRCTTSTTSCVFKKLDPWTAYSFTISTVVAAGISVPDSAPSLATQPVRIIKRNTRTKPTTLIKPASTGKQTWKATGGCKVTKDGKTFSATKDAGLCTLSLTTPKAGKIPKTTRTITVVVRAVAK